MLTGELFLEVSCEYMQRKNSLSLIKKLKSQFHTYLQLPDRCDATAITSFKLTIIKQDPHWFHSCHGEYSKASMKQL